MNSSYYVSAQHFPVEMAHRCNYMLRGLAAYFARQNSSRKSLKCLEKLETGIVISLTFSEPNYHKNDLNVSLEAKRGKEEPWEYLFAHFGSESPAVQAIWVQV